VPLTSGEGEGRGGGGKWSETRFARKVVKYILNKISVLHSRKDISFLKTLLLIAF